MLKRSRKSIFKRHEPQKIDIDRREHKLQYFSKGYWYSKMLVDYEIGNGKEKHQDVVYSGKWTLLPGNATKIKVRFQVMRFLGVWSDVKEYDRFKKCWVEPIQPHIFKYDTPVSCTYTLAGNLFYEAVMRVTGVEDIEETTNVEVRSQYGDTRIKGETAYQPLRQNIHAPLSHDKNKQEFTSNVLLDIAAADDSGQRYKLYETHVLDKMCDIKIDFQKHLTKLEWLESFKVVDADEECSERHLEIVCKFGKVPRTRDLINIFGKPFLPFVTYNEGQQYKWFGAHVLDKNSEMKIDFQKHLTKLEWLESFKVVDANKEWGESHLEIVCKFGYVPRTRDIINIFGKEILPFIEYSED